MADIAFALKQGKLSNLPSDNQNGTVYFTSDDTTGHALNGYIYYDSAINGEDVTKLPINGYGYHIDSLNSKFILDENFDLYLKKDFLIDGIIGKKAITGTENNTGIQIDQIIFNNSNKTYYYPCISGKSNTNQFLCIDGGHTDLTKNIYFVPNPNRTGNKNIGYSKSIPALNWDNLYLNKSLYVEEDAHLSNDLYIEGYIGKKQDSSYTSSFTGIKIDQVSYSTRYYTCLKASGSKDSGSIKFLLVDSDNTDMTDRFNLCPNPNRIRKQQGGNGRNLGYKEKVYHDLNWDNLYLNNELWAQEDITTYGTLWGLSDCKISKTFSALSGAFNIAFINSEGNLTNGYGVYPIHKVTMGGIEYSNFKGYLGTDSNPWDVGHIDTLYIDNGKVNNVAITSDKRLKTIESSDILNLDLKIYDSLKPVCYKYKNILPDDDFSRTHIGFLAQDVAKIIDDIGLTSEECALVQADPLEEDTSQQLKEICSDGYKYYLNYDELHGLHTLKNHQQDDRLTALEAKNKELENTISELKTQIELFKLAIGG